MTVLESMNPQIKEKILSLLVSADTGIVDYEVKVMPQDKFI
ncbi:hypothetical protein MASR2M39_12830 [Ignavibacteriales bacterium]